MDRNFITNNIRNKRQSLSTVSESEMSGMLPKINTFSKKYLLKLLGTGALVSCLAMPALAAGSHTKATGNHAKKPNVIMIVIDDAGFASLGAFGSEIETPNIDQLAYSGLRYNRFDSAAISAPTRAALITGRNPQTVNMEDLPPKIVIKPGPNGGMKITRSKAPANSVPLGSGPATSGEIPTNAENVAQAFQASGYSTYALGKWHLAPEYVDNVKRNKAFWPLQRGFNYYYGFISGHTDQYHPLLIEDNHKLPTPQDPKYDLSVDLVDHAINLMKPDSKKPKFLYLALGATHAPLQVSKSYIDEYKGKYAIGWDKLRQERFIRQKQLGIIPQNTVLPPRGKGDAAWNSLDAQHKRVFARFMATYAGFMTQTDEQIGRLIKYLKKTHQYKNTLIMLITDNGAASEGGPNGGFRTAYGDRTTVAQMDAHLDEAGGPKTYMLYQRPWAYADDTPFRRYKLWPYLGGVRTPLIVSWPGHIKSPGSVRDQYVNVVDLAPTMLDAAGTKFAKKVDGVKQIPVAGRSFLKTFEDKNAKTRSVQFFSLRGDRAITDGKWRAVAMHRLGAPFSEDQWQLFNTEKDFSESTDLAKKYPEKLKEMKKLWWKEARKYSNPPIIKPNPVLYKFNHMSDGLND
ncbi:arylsulfatase [Celerinatantimonas diazotrophica]|uniref:Arylsulfatase n=2 Tax=Celerinatantimonas diazotrophica TaxID=412034 RepID=A0A4R1J7A6_9GAMM|nr:arylsulfatase [Celerinatantimonas diazotrophica]CAG9295276.1 Arylsulfatase [Celerinatantimonas diazotrophica]